MNQSDIQTLMEKIIDGRNGHLTPERALEGLEMGIAGQQVKNSPYTIWQLINHINFWQTRFLDQLKGKELPEVASAADGWPGQNAPANQEDLDRALKYLSDTLAETRLLLMQPGELSYPQHYNNSYELVAAMGNHLSYHIGQIMLLRRIIGDYPPPSGGDTW